jgi:YHS domain-containing protein
MRLSRPSTAYGHPIPPPVDVLDDYHHPGQDLGEPILLSSGYRGEPVKKDLICGMDVDERTALSSIINGKPYYFSSAGCQANGEADPELLL